MKDNQHVQPVIDIDAETVTFNVKGHDSLVLEWNRLHPMVQMRAGLAGMAQVRIVDAAAVGMTDADGNILSEATRIAMKHERMARLIDHYHTGTSEWTLQRAEGAGGGARSLTIEAIARVKGITYEKAEESVGRYAQQHYKGDSKKALAYLRSGERVAKAMAEIRAERSGPGKVDADQALSEI